MESIERDCVVAVITMACMIALVEHEGLLKMLTLFLVVILSAQVWQWLTKQEEQRQRELQRLRDEDNQRLNDEERLRVAEQQAAEKEAKLRADRETRLNKIREDREVRLRQLQRNKDAKLSQLQADISSYRPGILTDRPADEGFHPPARTNIGVFGAQDSGKSALLNSMLFAFKGTWYQSLMEGDPLHQGGESIFREPVKLTDHLTLFDNRGMVDLGLSNVDRILEEIRGERGLDPNDRVTSGEPIDCPIFVFRSNPAIGLDHVSGFVQHFVNKIRKEFGSYPIVVITFEKDIPNATETENVFIMAGMARSNVFTIDNYTVRDHVTDTEKHMKLLELLKVCIKRGDDNINFRYLKGKEKVVQKGNMSRGWFTSRTKTYSGVS